MPLSKRYKFVLVVVVISSCKSLQKENQILTTGLSEPVEILRDLRGVNHTYAKNQYDLFFAQGYTATKDC